MSDETAGHSIESAAAAISGLLSPKKENQAAQDSPAMSAESATPDPQSPTGDAEPQDNPAPIGDEQTQGEPAETPPIDPPVSWDADGKAKFAALPRDVQEYVSKREADRNAEIRRLQNEAARIRQAAEVQRTQGTTQLQSLTKDLHSLAGALQQQVMGEFADIRSLDDEIRLSRENPARYVELDAKRKLLAQAQQAQQVLAFQHQQEQDQQRQRAMAEGRKRLAEAAPDLMSDDAKGEENRSALFGYLTKAGYSQEELGRVPDPRAFAVAWKAYKYDQAMAKQAQARKAGIQPPTVVKPGAANGVSNVEGLQAAKQQLRKTGSLNDAARVLSRIL